MIKKSFAKYSVRMVGGEQIEANSFEAMISSKICIAATTRSSGHHL